MVSMHLQQVQLINSIVARVPLLSKSNYTAMVLLSPLYCYFYCTSVAYGVQFSVLYPATFFQLFPSQSI